MAQSLKEQRERILAYARERFFVRGFSQVSIESLTADLAMSKKTFYQVFENKEELIDALLNERLTEVNATMERIFSSEIDSIQKLREMVSYLAAMLGSISKTAMLDVQRHYPKQWARLQKFRRERMTKNIVILLSQGIEEGYVRQDVPKPIFILAYLASVEAIVQPEVLAGESFSSSEAIEGIVTIFFGGILTDTGRRRLASLTSPQYS